MKQNDSMKQEDSNMMTVNEVTEYLKISRTTLHRLRKEGAIPSYQVSKSVRFKREEIEDYLQKQRKQ